MKSNFINNAGVNRIEFLLFMLGKSNLALEVSKVRKVINLPRIHNIPGSHSFVKGVSNFRGATIPVIDLAEALKVKTENDSRFMVVTDFKDKQVGLLIENVDKIVSIDASEIKEVPTFIKTHYLSSVTNYNNILREVLDLDKIFHEILIPHIA